MDTLKAKKAMIEFMQWKGDILSRVISNKGVRPSAIYFKKEDAEAIMKLPKYKVNKIVKLFNVLVDKNIDETNYYRLSDGDCCPFCIAYNDAYTHCASRSCDICPYAKVHGACERGSMPTSDYGKIMRALSDSNSSFHGSIVTTIGQDTILSKLKELFPPIFIGG